MVHFIYNIQYYIMFEVLEYSWQELVKDMKQSLDLDQLIAGHSKYLTYITDKLFLSSEPLLKDLTNLLDVIIRFCRAQENLYTAVLEESSKQNQQSQSRYERDMQDKWIKEEEKEDKEFEVAAHYQLPQDLKSQMNSLSEEYVQSFKAFQALLAKQTDENLRFLTFRFDFNGFYERRERGKPKVMDSFVSGVYDAEN